MLCMDCSGNIEHYFYGTHVWPDTGFVEIYFLEIKNYGIRKM